MLTTDQIQTRKIQIVLADDHRLVREQLDARLRREPDFEVVGVASTSRETWAEIQSKRPHMLLIDPLMRDGLGLATLRQVRAMFPDLVIAVLTAYVDTMLHMQFQEMDIQYVLIKGMVSVELLAELRTAASSHSAGNQEP